MVLFIHFYFIVPRRELAAHETPFTEALWTRESDRDSRVEVRLPSENIPALQFLLCNNYSEWFDMKEPVNLKKKKNQM